MVQVLKEEFKTRIFETKSKKFKIFSNLNFISLSVIVDNIL